MRRTTAIFSVFLGIALFASVSIETAAQEPSQSAAQPKRFEIADMQKIVRVADPQISPDDKSVALVVSCVNMKDDRQDAEIVLIDIASGAARTLTSRKGASSPRWSPTGDRLAFVAAVGEGKDAATQIFVLPMIGGDAKKVTNGPDGIEQVAWRPDGKMIAYVTPDPVDKKAIEAHHDVFEVGDTDFLETSAAQPSHVWLVSADGGEAKRVTSGAWSLPINFPPSPPSSPLSWSPDGKSLVITKQETPQPGDNDLTTIQILDVATGQMRKLTSHEKFEGAGEYSPDGSQVAYWYPRDGDPNNENEIFVNSASPAAAAAPGGAPAGNGNAGTDVTHAVDRSIQRAIWIPDGKSLLIGGHDATGTSMWLQPLDGSAAKRLDLGDLDPSWLFWIDAMVGPKGDIAFTANAPNRPPELYYLSSSDAKPRCMTQYNDWISSISLAAPKAIDWQGPNGFHEDGVLLQPPDFSNTKKYPLVLLIHGGPQASSTMGFSAFAQVLAAQGYLVFEPN